MATQAQSSRVSVLGLSQVSVTVTDLARATAFYRDVLALPLILEVPSMAFFVCGDTRLMLGLAEAGKPVPGTSVLYYKVDDVRTEERALAARGVKIVGASHFVARLGREDLWMLFFEDSEGNVMSMQSLHAAEGAPAA